MSQVTLSLEKYEEMKRELEELRIKVEENTIYKMYHPENFYLAICLLLWMVIVLLITIITH